MTSARISYDSPEEHTAKARVTLGDCFVVVAMGLVAAALGVGLMEEFSLGLAAAAGGAGVVFAALVFGHIALRRTPRAPLRSIDDHPARQADAGAVRDRRPASPQKAASAPPSRKTATKPSPDVSAPTAAKATAAKPAVPKEDAVALQDLDLGNFRPRAPADLTRKPSPATDAEADAGGNIDDMIRRLADDIEAGRKPAAPANVAEKPAVTLDPAGQKRKLPAPIAKASAAVDGAQLAPPPLPASAPLPPAATANRPAFPPTMVEAATPPALPTKAPAPPPTATAKLAAIADAL